MSESRAWTELDLGALERNTRRLQTQLPSGCRLMPAVKAEAYGHGALPVALRLQELGVEAFCVATAAEGARLRRGGVRGELLVLGAAQPADFPLAETCDLLLAAADWAHIRLLEQSGRRLRAHLALDTGMHRLGLDAGRPEDFPRLLGLKKLRLEGAFTHLCTGDAAFSQRQGALFWAAVERLRALGCGVEKAHLLGSEGLLRFPGLGGDYARVGIALYGYGGAAGAALGLEPVLGLKARVVSLRTVKRGEGAGYGLRFQARRDSRLAVLSIGYGDGLPRSLSCGRGAALIRGCRAPVAGLICMDQSLVDVTELPTVRPGDEAVLIGRSGDLRQSAEDLAQAAGTIPNEILSRLGPRLERVLLPEAPRP